jgi:hypothetical protein
VKQFAFGYSKAIHTPFWAKESIMGRRILNRKDLRADFDAAERRKDDEERDEEEEEGDEDEEEGDEDEEEAGDEEEGAAAGDEEEGEGAEDDEEAPKKKKKKVKVKEVAPKPKPKSRARAAKVVRMRVVWGVFDNSNRCVATYEYPRRGEADSHAARLMADKRSTHFVQPVKEPIEEKKEDKDEEKEKKKK